MQLQTLLNIVSDMRRIENKLAKWYFVCARMRICGSKLAELCGNRRLQRNMLDTQSLPKHYRDYFCVKKLGPQVEKSLEKTQKISTKNAKKNMKTCFGETASLAFEI